MGLFVVYMLVVAAVALVTNTQPVLVAGKAARLPSGVRSSPMKSSGSPDVRLVHHSHVAEFEFNAPVPLAGMVTRVEWTNPHVWIDVHVGPDQSDRRWAIEGDAPGALLGHGWQRDSLAPGMSLIVNGFAAKSSKRVACERDVVLPTGQTMMLSWCGPARSSNSSMKRDSPSSHIRSSNDRIIEVLDYAATRSAMFRRLLAHIDASDVTVFIDEGACQSGLFRACLQLLAALPAQRYLRVRIDPRQPLLSVVRQVAHELQHAKEVADAVEVVDVQSLGGLYKKIGSRTCSAGSVECWETRAALTAEVDVTNEILRYTPAVVASYFGEWSLAVERSTYDNRSALISGRRLQRNRGYGLISIVSDTTDADGIDRRRTFVYRPDGQEYLMSRSEEIPVQTIVVTTIDKFAARFVVRTDGTTSEVGRRWLTRDGMTMVEDSEGVDALGRAWRSHEVWQRRGSSPAGR